MNNVIEYKSERGKSIVFTAKTGFFLRSFSLLSGLSVSVNTSQSIDQIGETVDSLLVPAKSCTVSGFIQGDGTEGKKQLIDVIRPLEKGTITVNNEYRIDVVVSDAPTVSRERMFPSFDFGVTAPYPFWYKVAATTTPVFGSVGTFRFPWCIAKPYRFGVVVKSFFSTIVNNGQVPTFFDLDITANGEAKNPVFTNVDTGDFLKLNKTFAVGERASISISPDGVSAVSSLAGDIQGLIDIESTLFSFPPGETVMKYDAEENRENLTITLTLADKFSGVAV